VLTATDPGGRSTAKPVLVAFTIVVDRKARPSAVSDSGPWRQTGQRAFTSKWRSLTSCASHRRCSTTSSTKSRA